MKTKTVIAAIGASAIALSSLSYSLVAFAEDGDTSSSDTQSETRATTTRPLSSDAERIRDAAQELRQTRQTELEDRVASRTEAIAQRAETADEHRSVVASFVARLHEIASSTPGGIGVKVREVAREQEESDATTTDAIRSVEGRGALLRFLLGADKKSVDVLTTATDKIQQNIDRLTEVKASASTEVQASLDEQIKAMEAEKARIAALVDDNKNQAGVFGWLFRFFQK